MMGASSATALRSVGAKRAGRIRVVRGRRLRGCFGAILRSAEQKPRGQRAAAA